MPPLRSSVPSACRYPLLAIEHTVAQLERHLHELRLAGIEVRDIGLREHDPRRRLDRPRTRREIYSYCSAASLISRLSCEHRNGTRSRIERSPFLSCRTTCMTASREGRADHFAPDRATGNSPGHTIGAFGRALDPVMFPRSRLRADLISADVGWVRSRISVDVSGGEARQIAVRVRHASSRACSHDVKVSSIHVGEQWIRRRVTSARRHAARTCDRVGMSTGATSLLHVGGSRVPAHDVVLRCERACNALDRAAKTVLGLILVEAVELEPIGRVLGCANGDGCGSSATAET